MHCLQFAVDISVIYCDYFSCWGGVGGGGRTSKVNVLCIVKLKIHNQC